MMNDLLLIRCNVRMSPDRMKELRRDIKTQRETGTVVLPYYCDAIMVPEEIVTKWMNHKGVMLDD